MFASNEQDIAETLLCQCACLGHHLINGEGYAQDGIVSGETTIAAVIDAFIGEVKRGKEPDHPAKTLLGEGLRLLAHGLKTFTGSGGDKPGKISEVRVFFFKALFNSIPGRLYGVVQQTFQRQLIEVVDEAHWGEVGGGWGICRVR